MFLPKTFSHYLLSLFMLILVIKSRMSCSKISGVKPPSCKIHIAIIVSRWKGILILSNLGILCFYYFLYLLKSLFTLSPPGHIKMFMITDSNVFCLSFHFYYYCFACIFHCWSLRYRMERDHGSMTWSNNKILIFIIIKQRHGICSHSSPVFQSQLRNCKQLCANDEHMEDH